MSLEKTSCDSTVTFDLKMLENLLSFVWKIMLENALWNLFGKESLQCLSVNCLEWNFCEYIITFALKNVCDTLNYFFDRECLWVLLNICLEKNFGICLEENTWNCPLRFVWKRILVMPLWNICECILTFVLKNACNTSQLSDW